MIKRPIRVVLRVVALLTMVGATSLVVIANTGNVAQDGTSAWDGVFTEEQAERGHDTYQRECASCHLDDLLGDGIAPALVGAPFSFRWADLSIGDVYMAIRTTMPQGAPASLSKQGYLDIVAYLLQANKFPTGDSELPDEEDALQEIIIDEAP